jgi:putative flippase GtrA
MTPHVRTNLDEPPRGLRRRLSQAGRSRLARFAAVGVSGIVVNLAVLELIAGVLRWPEVAASAAAIEASILSNFVLNDRFTFRDRRTGGVLRRLVSFHAVTAVGALVQLGTFVAVSAVLVRTLGRPELGALRHVAQIAGIALAFGWNYLASVGLAWRAPGEAAVPAPSAARLAGVAAPVAFFALLALHALPMWLVRYFPTQDGPLHVENVLGLLHRADSPLLREFYLPNLGAQPNWITQVVLAGLVQGFSPLVAEKLVLTIYAVGLPLLFRAALPRGRRGWWAALGIFPFVHNFPFHMGFWNFSWGLALLFGAIAIWSGRRGRLPPARFAALAVVAVLLFFAHASAFAAFGVVVGATLAWRAGLALRRARRSPARRQVVLRGDARRAAAAAAVLAPGAVLLLTWTAAHRDRVSARIPLAELAARLAVLYPLVAIDRRELFLAGAVSLVLVVTVVHVVLTRTSRTLRPQDGWLAAALAFLVLYFALPDVAVSGAYISDRLALFAALCALAWIGCGSAPAAALRRFGIALSAVALLALGVRIEKQRAIAGYLEEYQSARPALAEGSVVLPLPFSPYGPLDGDGRRLGYRVKPFLHASGWMVAELGGVDLKNSQANTDQCPLRWPEGRNPFRSIAPSLGAMEATPPCVDLDVGAPGGGPIPYVLVWGATPALKATPCGAGVTRELAEGWERIFVSRPRGLLEVWRARPGATASAR